MRIAFVTASVSRKAGGLEEGVRRLAQSLSKGAADVRAFTLEDEQTGSDRSNWHPVPVKAFPVYGPAQFGFAPALETALLTGDAGVVMSNGLWMYPSIATHRWHKKTGRPYIVHPHGMLDPWAVKNSRWKKRLADFCYERRHLEDAACIRALCESEAEAIRAYGLKNSIVVIPNGIDVPEAGAEVSGRLGVAGGLKASGRKVLLYLGRIHPKKGLVNLLRAWGKVQGPEGNGERWEWILAIAGWDQHGHEGELKRLLTELNIPWHDVRAGGRELTSEICSGTSVCFLGPQFGPDKAACYRNCDAFILPSLSEGQPMAVLEAWAHGKPVLMTPECNLREGFRAGAALRVKNEDSENGPPKGAVTIEGGLRELFALPEQERTAMGERGRSLVAEHFSWPRIAADMKAVCEWILEGGQQPACVRVDI